MFTFTVAAYNVVRIRDFMRGNSGPLGEFDRQLVTANPLAWEYVRRTPASATLKSRVQLRYN
jgi:hypothetical protein